MTTEITEVLNIRGIPQSAARAFRAEAAARGMTAGEFIVALMQELAKKQKAH